MEVDARTLTSAALDADVCVVGAGPVGLTVARALAAHDTRIVVLESGGHNREPDVQALSDGTTLGDAYAGPGPTRHRQAGGTAVIWNTWLGDEMGAKYVPLDAIDFEAREWLPLSGWPFDRASLDPYYQRAQSLCGLGPYRYGGDDWATPDRPLLPLSSGSLATDVYQFGPARLFTDVYLRDVRAARNVLLCLHATAVELAADPSGRLVTDVRAARVTGRPLRVRARQFVLAAGGIENARLLLLSNGVNPAGLGNDSDMVGRCFMEHPRDRSCRLVPAHPGLLDRCGFYSIHRTDAGLVMGRIAFTEEARRRDQLPAMSVTLQPSPRRFRWLRASRRRGDVLELLINLEQAPDRDNRVVLGTDPDRYDRPKPVIHWRWRELDRSNLARVHAALASGFERSGIGRLVIDAAEMPDPNAHHHMGTTRMSNDPRAGVVTKDGRVHGVANLFVTGSSVFPTGGFANPTLTTTALALRLADHLRGR